MTFRLVMHFKYNTNSVGSWRGVPSAWQGHGTRDEPAKQLFCTQGCPGTQYVPSGATRTRKESARQIFPARLSQGPGISLSSFCLTIVGLSINFWKYIVIRPRWKSPSLLGNAHDCSGSGHDHKHQVKKEKATGIVWLLA